LDFHLSSYSFWVYFLIFPNPLTVRPKGFIRNYLGLLKGKVWINFTPYYYFQKALDYWIGFSKLGFLKVFPWGKFFNFLQAFRSHFHLIQIGVWAKKG